MMVANYINLRFCFIGGYEDYNLCEHAMWCWALMGYMQLGEATERYEKDVENALKIMTNQHGVRLERMTYDR